MNFVTAVRIDVLQSGGQTAEALAGSGAVRWRVSLAKGTELMVQTAV